MPGSSGPDPLATIRERAPDYRVFGELGRTSDDDVWYLARKEGEDPLVAIRLSRKGVDEWGDPRYEISVATELGSDVPTDQGNCLACGAQLRSFARFCTRCGADQSGGMREGTSDEERKVLLAEVRAAAAEVYDVLGEMPQAERGGTVYFALERDSGELVRLRLREGNEGMELQETAVAMHLDQLVTATRIRSGALRRPSVRMPPPLGVTAPPSAPEPPAPEPPAPEPAAPEWPAPEPAAPPPALVSPPSPAPPAPRPSAVRPALPDPSPAWPSGRPAPPLFSPTGEHVSPRVGPRQAPRSSDRERQLIWTVVILAAIVLVETTLLLVR
jgi:hypothetical protein